MDLLFSPPEPWRVKSVEPITLVSRDRREAAIRQAGYNVFRLASEDVFVDLLTDSGTGAMSAGQWAGLQFGDESYAGARNWFNLEGTVRQITGLPHVIPVHQGRGAETVYCRAFVDEGDLVIGNLHFDTTRSHIRNRGGLPVDLVVREGLDPDDSSPFKGNVDLDRAERLIAENPGRIRLLILTVTSNTNGGQPVSLENARAVSDLCHRHGIRLLIDAARFAENCYLIKEREAGQLGRSVKEIAAELFSLADAVAMSAKKDALVNIGGFLALRSEEDAVVCRRWAVLYEGYLTYGGMAGRDLEAVARGLIEGMDEDYLAARIEQVRLLHALIDEAGVPVIRPPGGHSVVIDAAAFLSHLPRSEFPAESLAIALYLEGGLRTVGLGGLAFGDHDDAPEWARPPDLEYLRMAVPRRVYTDNHIAHAAAVVRDVWAKREEVVGLQAVDIPVALPHFTAVFEPAGSTVGSAGDGRAEGASGSYLKAATMESTFGRRSK
jgi:tryptophanase